MITLNAKINLDYDKTVAVITAESNIPDSNGNYNLSSIINVVSATPFIGTVPSQRNGAFYDEFNADRKTIWQKGERETFTFSGREYYNNVLCIKYIVGYVADLTLSLPYTNQIDLHQVVVKSEWQDRVFYNYTTNLNVGTVGVLVEVYIPLELANSGEIVDPADAFPEVMVYATASRPQGTIGKVYEITVTTDKPTTSLELVFDQANNYHPTRVEIDGSTFAVNKAVFSTDSLPFGNEHIIKIYDWNNPRSNLFIYGISSHLIDWTNIDYRVLINVDSSIFASSDIKRPSIGIMSNSGNLEFNDPYGLGEYFADQGVLIGGIPVEFYIKNTLTSKSQKIATYYTADWRYDSNSRHFSVSVKDDLEEWQDIEIDGFGYDPRNPKSVLADLTMANLYIWLHERTPSKYNMVSFEELDATTQGVLNKTVVPYPFLKKANLWATWQKLCVACSLNIFKSADGKTLCLYALGV